GGGRAHQEAAHRHDRHDRGTRPYAAAARVLERAGPDCCPAWEHDKQQPADHLPERPCPGTLPEIHRHARELVDRRRRPQHVQDPARLVQP
ncbi:hypothetical protein T492DRAFT_918237, partial [Pavlovales sp. CCMP2436]